MAISTVVNALFFATMRPVPWKSHYLGGLKPMKFNRKYLLGVVKGLLTRAVDAGPFGKFQIGEWQSPTPNIAQSGPLFAFYCFITRVPGLHYYYGLLAVPLTIARVWATICRVTSGYSTLRRRIFFYSKMIEPTPVSAKLFPIARSTWK